ncbi:MULTISPECIES: hypothetical protein [Pedobacter]|uniref:hypothetical protein n=1 Tax=Pedobacter TaxID=84567 RepID=UPI0012E0B296|nr:MULTISPECIES: hypothetical protein [Pedobacter]
MNFRLVYTVLLLAFSFLLDQCLVLENPHNKISQYNQRAKHGAGEFETVLHAIILSSSHQEVNQEKDKFSFDTFRTLNHPYFFLTSHLLQAKPVLQNSSIRTYFLKSPCFRGPPKSVYNTLAGLSDLQSMS